MRRASRSQELWQAVRWPGVQPRIAVVAAVLTAYSAMLADTMLREGWSSIATGWHLVAATGLYTAVGAVVGLLFWVALTLLTNAGKLAGRGVPRAEPLLYLLWSAALAAALCWRTARWLFAGPGAERSGLHRWGAEVSVVLVAGAVGLWGWWLLRSWAALRAGRARPAVVMATAALGIGAAGFYADLTVLVSLYAQVHRLLELFADAALVVGFTLGLSALQRRFPPMARLARAAALLAVCWSLVFLGSGRARSWIDRQLSHVWQQPLYVGRALLRVQLAESYLADPSGWKGARRSRLERLTRRYDLGSTSLSPIWNQPADAGTPASWHPAPAGQRDYAVVVFYVDTLRYDAAVDRAIMPNLVRLAERSVVFRHAYSSASDTVSAMPAMMRARFDDEGGDDLLALARRAATPHGVVIPRSAARFLRKHYQDFRFDDTVVVPDYAEGKKVWGYGADQSTASRVVDRGLEWLEEHRNEPSLLWLFHYDLHNWRELDREHVYGAAKRLSLPDEAPLNWRYRSVAAAIDEQLGRFVETLERTGQWDRTILLVLSDHGEGVGRKGHWVHAVFLWEALVHVPLMMRVPGVPPTVVDAPVGHVDLLPTLARYLAPNIPVGHRHGEDLLAFARDPTMRRRYPLLMQSSQRDTLLRIGLVEPDGRHKLVLPLEAAVAELYDLRQPEPDDAEVSARHRHDTLRWLDQLVRSPYFPRELLVEDDRSGRPGS